MVNLCRKNTKIIHFILMYNFNTWERMNEGNRNKDLHIAFWKYICKLKI